MQQTAPHGLSYTSGSSESVAAVQWGFHAVIYRAILFGLLASVGSAAAADWMGWSFGISGGGGTGTSTHSDSGLPCGAFGTCCPAVVPETVSPQIPPKGCFKPPPPCPDCGGDGTY